VTSLITAPTSDPYSVLKLFFHVEVGQVFDEAIPERTDLVRLARGEELRVA
jgi:hypothetical protein